MHLHLPMSTCVPSTDNCLPPFKSCSLPVMARYTLIQVFSKCGKVAKMDFLFHKTGPLKGKPRGYAFVEYSTKEVSSVVRSDPGYRNANRISTSSQEAAKAVAKLHDRVLRGRKLAVSPAAAVSHLFTRTSPLCYMLNSSGPTSR